MPPRRTHLLVLGAFRPALESALARLVADAKREDPAAPVLVLVGSSALAVYLNRLLARRIPLWDVRFVTFAQLASRLGSDALRARRLRPISDLARRCLLRDVIREHAAGYFAPVAALPGFVRTVAESIADLKEAGLGPDALLSSRSPKMNALAAIFKAYESRLADLGFHDGPDLLAAAADAAPRSGSLPSAAFIAYGFYDLNGLQRNLLRALASRARSAAALVPCLDAPAFDYARPLVRWLRKNGFRKSATPAEPDAAPPDSAGPLAARLFAPPAGSPIDHARFRILSAPGEAHEAREAVRQVLDFAAAGVPLGEIAVLLRNPDAYSQLVRDALALRGIPCYVAHGTPLIESIEARSLILLLDLLDSGFRRADVMQFVHFAPVPFDSLLGRSPDLPAWDLLSIRAGIQSGPDRWAEHLDRFDRAPSNDDDPRRAALRSELASLRSFIRLLSDAARSLPGSAKWSDHAAVLLDIFRRFVAPSENRSRVESQIRSLAELDALGTPAGRADLRDALLDLLQSNAVRSEGFLRGHVYLGGLFQSRGLSFRAVIIPGLVEKGFPPPARQDPVLLDQERAALARAFPSACLPPRTARSDEERLLFALALDAGSDRVTLSFPRLDPAAARERIPSHFLPRLVEALTGQRCDWSHLEQSAPGFLRVPMFSAESSDRTPVDLDEFDLRQVAALVRDGRPEETLYLEHLCESFRRALEAESARWQKKTFTRFDGRITAVRDEHAAERILSPTRLERYAICPFIYFIERVLGVEILEEPETNAGIPPLERGALVHRVFYAAYSAAFAKDAAPTAAQRAAALRSAAEAEFRSLPVTGPALTWALDRAEILADLDRFAQLDADDCAARNAVPLWFEVRFGMPPRGPDESPASIRRPLEIQAGGRLFRFRGKIDRIDRIGPDAARVVDYKTGSPGPDVKPNRFRGGRALQLPIYLLAADLLLKPLTRTALTAQYAFATSRGAFASVEFDRKTLDDRRADFDRILVTIDDSIRNGLFIQIPNESRCRFCEFSNLCGANSDILFDRKKDDPAARDLLDLEDIE